MEKARLEAFTDGVIAVIITILVLELKVPEGATLGAFARRVAGVFCVRAEFSECGEFLE